MRVELEHVSAKCANLPAGGVKVLNRRFKNYTSLDAIAWYLTAKNSSQRKLFKTNLWEA